MVGLMTATGTLAFTREIDIFSGTTKLATIRIKQPYGGVATFEKVTQHVSGSFNLEIEANSYSPATFYDDVYEYTASTPFINIITGVVQAAAGTRRVTLRAIAGSYARIKVGIVTNPGTDAEETLHGEEDYSEYVTERNAYYKVD